MDLISVLSAGLRMGSRYWKELLILVLMAVEMGAITVIFFTSRDEEETQIGMIFFGGSWIFLSLVAVLLSLLKIFSLIPVLVLMAGGAGLIIFKREWRSFLFKILSVKIIIPLLIWVFFLILYLGYLEPLWLPPFHDSPFHFQFTRDFLNQNGQGWRLFTRLFKSYYHLGFHGITAWLAVLKGGLHPLDLAFMGQYFLSLVPVTIYVCVVSFTGKKTAGLISALAVGIGWPMPFQAADWGKYPLILGLMIFPLVIGLIDQNKEDLKGKKLFLLLMMCIGLVWIHSRFAVVLGIVLISYILVYRLRIGWVSAFFMIALFVALIFYKPSWTGLSYYTGKFLYPTLAVGLFLPFALISATEKTLFWICFAFLLQFSSLVGLPAFFHHYSSWLIDPGFINIIFVIPLVILEGLGFSSWMEKKTPIYVAGMAVVIIGFLFWNSAEYITLQPRDATNFSSLDDLVSMQWIEDQLPPGGLIFISGQQRSGDWEGQDAGIWITPLKGRETEYLSFNSEWCLASLQDRICSTYKQKIPLYIYQGHMENSFSLPNTGQCAGIETVLSFPQARIYQLNCD